MFHVAFPCACCLGNSFHIIRYYVNEFVGTVELAFCKNCSDAIWNHRCTSGYHY